jgi:hypothetical protein
MYAARTYSNDAFDMTREAIRKPPPLISRAILPVPGRGLMQEKPRLRDTPRKTGSIDPKDKIRSSQEPARAIGAAAPRSRESRTAG